MNPLKPPFSLPFVITLGILTAVPALTVDISLPAVPDMAVELVTSLSRGQLIVGVFMAGMACGQIPSGLLADRLGRLPVLYTGMGLFTAGAIAAAVAKDIDLLLLARFVQGIGAASPLVLSRAIVRDVASGREAAKLMSLMTMIFTAAPVIAPTLGAVMVAQWGWRAPFVAIAILAVVVLGAIRCNIRETHTGNRTEHPVRQLASSFAEFFSHRQSILALMLIVIPPAGYMSIIAVAASLVVEIYGYTIAQFGLIFAAAGISILLGAAINQRLVGRLQAVQIIAIGIGLMAVSSAQLLFIAWLDHAPLGWLWACVCMFMFTIAVIVPNATVLALDPLPRIAGVASSIIGTLQNVLGAGGALLGAMLYDGSIRRSVIILGTAGVVTSLVFLLRRLVVPKLGTRRGPDAARD